MPRSSAKAADILEGIPDGEPSALVQAALGRAYLSSFNLSKDAALAEKAKAAAERAVRLDPGLPEAQITAARVLRATGRPAEALPIVRKVLEKDPGNAEAVATLARRAAERRRLRRRRDDVAAARRDAPHVVVRHKDLAGFFFSRNRYEDAAREYQKAMELNPGVYGLSTASAPSGSGRGASTRRSGR